MAHTGDGKSAIARQICEATAKAGGGVIWYCGEDPEDATAERYLADGCNISATEIGRLDLTSKQLDKIELAAKSTSEWSKRIQVIFEAPSVEEVLRTVTQTTEVNGCPLMLGVFDYLQIFGDSHSLEGEIAKLATGLNQLSGERRIASLLLSQVSNEVYRRGQDRWNSQKVITGFTPGLGDTEWCRRAEKSVKALWSVFRPGRWLRQMGEEAEDNIAEVHIIKGNFGPTGWAEIGWDGPSVRFYNKDVK